MVLMPVMEKSVTPSFNGSGQVIFYLEATKLLVISKFRTEIIDYLDISVLVANRNMVLPIIFPISGSKIPVIV